jgi:hypothetical protein
MVTLRTLVVTESDVAFVAVFYNEHLDELYSVVLAFMQTFHICWIFLLCFNHAVGILDAKWELPTILSTEVFLHCSVISTPTLVASPSATFSRN